LLPSSGLSKSVGSRTAVAPEVVRLPLDRVALCLDCEMCFPVEQPARPSCGSRSAVPIARFLSKGREPAASAA
jgi:hypothetical protein